MINAKLNAIRPISTLAIYVALVVWVSLCLIALWAVVNLNLRDAERSFTDHGEDYVDKLNRSMVSSETVLKGFSALFAAIGNTNPEKVSVYVKSVIETNGQIFALEIIQKVERSSYKILLSVNDLVEILVLLLNHFLSAITGAGCRLKISCFIILSFIWSRYHQALKKFLV